MRIAISKSDSPMILYYHRFHRLTTLIPRHPPLFHSTLKTFHFCKSFPPYPSLSSSGLTLGIPRIVYQSSENIRFLLFLNSTISVAEPTIELCGRLSWLTSAFERTLKYHLVQLQVLFEQPFCPCSRHSSAIYSLYCIELQKFEIQWVHK